MRPEFCNGFVSGLEVLADSKTWWKAAITPSDRESTTIDVKSDDHGIGLALALAAVSQAVVTVTFEGEDRIVREIRFLDVIEEPKHESSETNVRFAALTPGKYPTIEIKGVKIESMSGAHFNIVSKQSVNRLYFDASGLTISFPTPTSEVQLDVSSDGSDVRAFALDGYGNITGGQSVSKGKPIELKGAKEIKLFGGGGHGYLSQFRFVLLSTVKSSSGRIVSEVWSRHTGKRNDSESTLSDKLTEPETDI